MKLKSYMRGLGIGIVVTALIMGIATKDGRPMTDAEIKAAAAKLGMVDSNSLRLTDLNQDRTPESPEPHVEGHTESDPSDQESDQGGQDGDESESGEDGEKSEEEPTPEPTPTPTPEPT
ncbi:MAG: hypothetical protein K2J60_06615, partial [Acetatifactor sp.]|nr:hypothetical protein [Acetatifactor sp.]